MVIYWEVYEVYGRYMVAMNQMFTGDIVDNMVIYH